MSIPAMLTLCGSVAHVFHAPGGIDSKTGEAYEGGARVQLMAQVPLKNGEAKYDLVTLSTDSPKPSRRSRASMSGFQSGPIP